MTGGVTKKDGGNREIVSGARERFKKKIINKLLVKEKDYCAILFLSTSRPPPLSDKFIKRQEEYF